MQPLLFNMGVASELFDRIVRHLEAEPGTLTLRGFPDGESYLRFETDCEDRHAVLVCSLDQPNIRTVPLLLASDILRDLGAERVGLIAPYLAYMRQDKAFQVGEGMTARFYAQLLSAHFDWLVTVDPHLHRISTLADVYTIPTRSVHAAPLLAAWVTQNVRKPVLIGPDSESKQWVSEVADRAQVPYLVLEKKRSGDRQVRVSIPNFEEVRGRIPVLVDDIVSTGQTLVASVEHLINLGAPAPVCIAVHGIFAEGALTALRDAGVEKLVTCNTIEHETNTVDVSEILVAGASVFIEP